MFDLFQTYLAADLPKYKNMQIDNLRPEQQAGIQNQESQSIAKALTLKVRFGIRNQGVCVRIGRCGF